jgi:hypothetical protein
MAQRNLCLLHLRRQNSLCCLPLSDCIYVQRLTSNSDSKVCDLHCSERIGGLLVMCMAFLNRAPDLFA